MTDNYIHETAIIDPEAIVADDVQIGPWTYIGPQVEIGAGTIINSHVVIKGPTRIGSNNHIFQFSSIGEEPQDKKYKGEATLLEIGDRNIIRESVTIHRGTVQGGGLTRLGNDNLLMAYAHIAHDCLVGNHTIFANTASLAGHVVVDDHATVGGFTGIHQFCHIGAYSFVAKAMVTKDVLPFMMVSGHEPTVCGLNSVGLKRHGFTDDDLASLKRAYKIIFRKGYTAEEALTHLQDMTHESRYIDQLIQALKSSERGIVR